MHPAIAQHRSGISAICQRYRIRRLEVFGSATGAVQRELAGLSEVGLLTVRKQGNQKHYQANASAPMFAELRSLVLKTMVLTDERLVTDLISATQTVSNAVQR